MDTITRTFSTTLNSTYVANSIIELGHFRDMAFDTDERVGIYLEAWMCNLNFKSFLPAVIPEFDGDESEAEKMALFTAAENKSQKIGLQILGRKNNTGAWQEKAEVILVNRGRKDYFDLMQPYLAKNTVRILEKSDAIAIQLIDYGNGLLKTTDSIGIELGVTITIAKKNNMDIFNARLAALELALENRLTNVPAGVVLGRDTSTGTIQTIPQSRFATPQQIDQAIVDLVGGAPGALNTLIELAAALNNDANFASTITNALALKAPLDSPSFTGFAKFGDNVALKIKRIIGITPSAEGGVLQTIHGLDGNKIIGLLPSISHFPNSSIPSDFDSFSIGHSYDVWHDSLCVNLMLAPGNSGYLLNKSFSVLIFYTN
ncbi:MULTISPECIES: hypothetical protein [unclassified Microcoleus]|uniref:hypothetical protein n=1 Tax=unclassified Microcoleus TaxID=2642155 RepID=UPI002FD2426D